MAINPNPDGWSSPAAVRSRVRRLMAMAIKQHDDVALAAYRSVLSAIDNAEAVDLPPTRPALGDHPIAGGVVGLGKGDVPRRGLTDADVARIIRAEVDEREEAARLFDAAGRADRAARIRAEAAVIREQLQTPD